MPSRFAVPSYLGWLLALAVSVLLAGPAAAQADKPKVKAPEFETGLDWLNVDKPLTIKELKGKIVLLDFWTLCCINCIHVLPDLDKLEKKYPNEVVVIGVHSPKFENEKNTESIRKAILRYEVKHPVVNDANSRIWRTYGVNAWPTLVVIDPEGHFVGYASGEGNYEVIDKVITKLIKEHVERETAADPAGEGKSGIALVLPRQGAGGREGQSAVHRR
jgi:thiol-disulfide isomerase/thioredoxin